jgi:hypothetical protein
MSTASDRLQLYLDAERNILEAGQAVMFDGGVRRSLTQANLADIRAEIAHLQRQVAAESRIAAGGSGLRFQTANFSDR